MMPSYLPPTPEHYNNSKWPLVSMRSDTESRPTPAMRKAMFEAEVGDDVYGEDPTVNALQRNIAKLFNKEAALFLPTGTMGNVVAVLAHCDRRGLEILVGDQCHIFLYEQGAPAQLGGIHTRTLPNLPDGTFDLELMERSIRGDDQHAPVTGLICVENTHNMCGGAVLPYPFLQKLWSIAESRGIPVHMDGARIFNAAVATGRSVAELTAGCASVQFCFSKGLGCPAGSALVGSKDFIRRAHRLRKVLGAGMRQVGVLAAPCQVALDTMIDRLAEDHANSKLLADGIMACNSPLIRVDMDKLHTNILMVHFKPELFSSTDFITRMSEVTSEEANELGRDSAVIVRLLPKTSSCCRIVLYWEITSELVEKVVRKIQYVVKEVTK